ncbi:VOC family protein [Aeromicrobium sp.]|uniref:VOC family protein n=1 Tax=Aeromicrobium sp. TaxID=1871063 RepID=UPI0030BB9730
MATILNPYLSFEDTAAAAMTFYQSVLGGDLTTSTFGEFGMSEDPAHSDKIMHAQLQTPGGLTLMAADVPPDVELQAGNNMAISLSGEDESELRGFFDGLADGGSVDQPFVQAPWGDTFGMLTDRFGTTWMVNALGPQAQSEG